MGGAPPDYTPLTLQTIYSNTKSAFSTVMPGCSVCKTVCVSASGKALTSFPDSSLEWFSLSGLHTFVYLFKERTQYLNACVLTSLLWMLFWVKFLWLYAPLVFMLIVLQRCQFEHTCQVTGLYEHSCVALEFSWLSGQNNINHTLASPEFRSTHLYLCIHNLVMCIYIYSGWVGLQSNQWSLMVLHVS